MTLWKVYAHRSRLWWSGLNHPATPLLFVAAFSPGHSGDRLLALSSASRVFPILISSASPRAGTSLS